MSSVVLSERLIWFGNWEYMDVQGKADERIVDADRNVSLETICKCLCEAVRSRVCFKSQMDMH